jgi:tryptophanyl-tRNA synthetase
VRLQDTADPDTTLLFCSVDLHAVTVPQPPAVLAAHRRQCLASLLAIGLDPSRSIVFHQSAVPAHSELMWLLSCSASVGYLSRMTQWKVGLIVALLYDSDDLQSKIKEQSQLKPLESAERLGLFSYPVLQAADILAYGYDYRLDDLF